MIPITSTTRRASPIALPFIAGLSALVAKFPRADLLKRLERARVPAGPINGVAEVFADPQIIDRGMRFNLPRPEGTNVPTVRTPILMSETHLVYGRASPRLGEHTSDVLAEIGYAPEAVTGLMSTRVVGGVSPGPCCDRSRAPFVNAAAVRRPPPICGLQHPNRPARQVQGPYLPASPLPG